MRLISGLFCRFWGRCTGADSLLVVFLVVLEVVQVVQVVEVVLLVELG